MSTTTEAVRARARVLIDELPLVTYVVQLEAPSPTIYVSPQFEALFGYSPDECAARGDFWLSWMVPADRAPFLEAFQRMRETHESMSVEYRVLARDGREVWVRGFRMISDEDGRALVHGYLTDMTGRRSSSASSQASEHRQRHSRRGAATNARHSRNGNARCFGCSPRAARTPRSAARSSSRRTPCARMPSARCKSLVRGRELRPSRLRCAKPSSAESRTRAGLRGSRNAVQTPWFGGALAARPLRTAYAAL